MAQRIGLAAAVRFLLAHKVRLLARGLVVPEDALVDDRELRGLHAFVVVAHGGQRARRGAVADERAVLARDALADLVQRDVAGAGVVGLVAQRAVEFGGMRHALVNRQHQVVRHQQQVLLAGLHGRRGEVLHHFFADALRVLFQVHLGHVFPSGRGLRGRVVARARDVVLAIHRGGVHVAVDLEDQLLNRRAFGRREVFVLAAQAEGRVAAEDLRRSS